MAKRTASNELNYDNWCDEEEPEEAGTFKRASADDMKRRQIKTARRRGPAPSSDNPSKDPEEQAGTKSIFAGFSGFKKAEPSSAKAVFSFLSASSNGNNVGSGSGSSTVVSGSPSASKVDVEKKSANGIDSQSDMSVKANNDKEYYRKLKGLNESVSKWISTHVASNPLCILTPVFRDYEKHLANIQSSHFKDNSKSCEGISALEGPQHSTVEVDKDSALIKGDDKTIINTVAADKVEDKSKDEKKTFNSSLLGSTASSTSTGGATFSFGTSGTSAQGQSQFCFGSTAPSNTTSSTPTFSFGTGGATSPSAGFSFGAAKPFTFLNVANPSTEEQKDDEDGDDDTPPKPDHKPVNEDGATYTKRCKVFIKQGKEYSDRGIGNLFLKPVEGGKTQLIVRADTSLGNVLLNFLLSSGLPFQRLGSNNVAVVCIPTPEAQPPPVTVLLRVKTSDDADELLETLEKHKKAT